MLYLLVTRRRYVVFVGHQEKICCICWSPGEDMLYLLVTRRRYVVFVSRQEKICCICWSPGEDMLYLLVTRRRYVVFVGHQEKICCICWSPGEDMLYLLVTRRRYVVFVGHQEKMSVYERAVYATYSGNLDQLLPVCHTWEDHLWAYLRVMVDVRLEQEVRINSALAKQWQKLPDRYWNHR